MYEGNGLTVKELKKILEDCPDYDLNGEPTEVFIETGKMLSSPVTVVCCLNYREREEKKAWDVILESNAFENNL